MESRESKWLKSVFRETEYSSDCPPSKRTKFADVSTELSTQFSDSKFSAYEVSRLVQEAFPHTESKACGKSRQKHILGLERIARSETPASVARTTSSQTPTTPTPSQPSSYADLLIEIRELKDRVLELEKTSATTLCRQADTIIQHKSPVTQGPHSLVAFREFNLDSVIAELQSRAPDLYQLILTLGDTKRNTEKDEVTIEDRKAISSMCSLLNARSARMKGPQLLMSMMLVARATSKQAIAVLSHSGMCMSYTSTWSYLLKLTNDAQYKEQVQEGHWIWVYDNLNLHQVVRHEREDKHSAMLNVTARLAVCIRNLPDWEVDWDDTTPQCPRSELGCDHFLPSIADADALNEAAVQYTMEFLVEEFECLKDLKHHVPPRQSPHSVGTPTVAPMEILFKDEKFKAETIEIIRQLMKDAALCGSSQVVVGDQLTCKNIRAMKAWTLTEAEQKHRLQWAHEVPGDFHFLWECLRIVFSIFWGTPSDIGSLCNMREFISRKLVNKKVKTFNVGDEFLMHAFKAHYIARICSILGVSSPDQDIPHTQSTQWLKDKAQVIVQEAINPIRTTTDPAYMKHRSFLHLAFLYVDLRLAIQWEDGPHIIRHWKLWLPRFIGTGCKNYAAEAVNLLSHLQADFPKHIAYIAMHNRTVNTRGKPGHGKPIDQLMEHYVLVVKQALRCSGANITDKHITDVSMCALFLLEAAKKCDTAFGVPPQSTSHTVRDAKSDIGKIYQHLLDNQIAKEVKDRTTPAFIDPMESGLHTLTQGDWLQKQLRSKFEDYLQNEESHGEVDIDYELADTT